VPSLPKTGFVPGEAWHGKSLENHESRDAVQRRAPSGESKYEIGDQDPLVTVSTARPPSLKEHAIRGVDDVFRRVGGQEEDR